MGMRMLRAEHNDLRVLVYSNVVPRGPVEQVIRSHTLLLARAIGRSEAAFQNESPMRTLAEIAIKSLKQRRRIDSRRKGKVLAADMVVATGIPEIRFLADQKLMDKFTRIKELRAHSSPSLTYAEMFDLMADFYLKAHDPVEKAKRAESRKEESSQKVSNTGSSPITSPAKLKIKTRDRSRFIPSAIKHEVWKRDLGICTYKDPVTKRPCGSRFGLELDHLHPYSMGGEHSVENLRLRCKHHNQLHWMRSQENSKAFRPI